MPEESEKIRITLDEVAKSAEVFSSTAAYTASAQTSSTPPQPGAPRQWGSISGPSSAAGMTGSVSGSANIFMRAWFYLGLAGTAGAFFAWAVCEPGFNDGVHNSWGNTLMMPLIIMFMCFGLGVAESIVERSVSKAILRGLFSLIIGLVLGFIFDYITNILYNILLNIFGKPQEENPLHWLIRSMAWAGFGVTAGLVYGIVGLSPKKLLYGVIGGVIGAGLGGFIFDPICLISPLGGGPSRFIGFTLLGATTGIAVGLVESVLKDRWLYVSAGPLAGKQFIIYKSVTKFGRDQSNDIYLFKDLSIQPLHAMIEMRGNQAILYPYGPTTVGGQTVLTPRPLRSSDLIQIGRYSFQYQEKSKQNNR